MFCAPEKHRSNIEINHNELQHHFEVNILKLCQKCQCPLSFPRFAAIAATLLPNKVLACARVKKIGGSPNPCRSSIGGAGRHPICALPGEHWSLENTGPESTNTSSATGHKQNKYRFMIIFADLVEVP